MGSQLPCYDSYVPSRRAPCDKNGPDRPRIVNPAPAGCGSRQPPRGESRGPEIMLRRSLSEEPETGRQRWQPTQSPRSRRLGGSLHLRRAALACSKGGVWLTVERHGGRWPVLASGVLARAGRALPRASSLPDGLRRRGWAWSSTSRIAGSTSRPSRRKARRSGRGQSSSATRCARPPWRISLLPALSACFCCNRLRLHVFARVGLKAPHFTD